MSLALFPTRVVAGHQRSTRPARQPAVMTVMLAPPPVPSAGGVAGSAQRPVLPRPATTTIVEAEVTQTEALTKSQVLSMEYNRAMKDAMGWGHRPYEYDYSRGLYYHEILPNLVCGSQPRHSADVEELKRDLSLSTIVSLQQDKDMQYWNVNPHEIRHRCETLGISLIRCPMRDFDPHSLRKVLPMAVRELHQALTSGGRVYVHCTAGLGRAPGVIIAYLYWFHNMDLDTAYEALTTIRPCGPKKEAIRGATFDLLSGKPLDHFDRQQQGAYARITQEERAMLQARILSA